MNQVDTEGLDLFNQPWPERRPAPASEQRPLDLPEVSIEARYRAWRATEDGQRAWEAITAEAGILVASGASRLSSKALVETVRGRLKIQINNSYTAGISRDLRDIPAFRDLVELRERTAL